jgi:hypothetical protein
MYNEEKECDSSTYQHCYPVQRLSAKAEHDSVHPSRWYAADAEIYDVESSKVSPYRQKLQKCERTAKWKDMLEKV